MIVLLPFLRYARERSRNEVTRVRVIGSARWLKVQRGDPITLTLVASRLDLSHFVGEV
jgi:hypothetical protein